MHVLGYYTCILTVRYTFITYLTCNIRSSIIIIIIKILFVLKVAYNIKCTAIEAYEAATNDPK